jgi:small subunit ribosomal protein S14
MARKCLIRKENKRTVERNKKWEKRNALREVIKSISASLEQKQAAHLGMAKLGRDSSPIRQTRRCRKTGRSRGVWRRFELCRHMIRNYAMRGDIPGLVKASW